MISMYSHKPEIHDELKNTPGVFGKALEAMNAIRDSSIELMMQTVPTRPLLAEIDPFIEWARQTDTTHLFLTYLEGHQTEGLRPTRRVLSDAAAQTDSASSLPTATSIDATLSSITTNPSLEI